MSLEIGDAETDRLVRELALQQQIKPDEAIKLAVRNELDRDPPEAGLWERMKPVHDRIAARPATGLDADKAFYDSLNDE